MSTPSAWSAVADFDTTGTGAVLFTNNDDPSGAGPESVYVQTTSTSTIYPPNPRVGEVRLYQMFGVNYQTFGATLTSTTLPDEEDETDEFAPPASTLVDAWAAALSGSGGSAAGLYQWMEYVEANGYFGGVFDLTTVPALTHHRQRLVHATRVPAYRDVSGSSATDDFDYRDVDYATSPGLPGVLQDEGTAVSLALVYKDPCVFYITDDDTDGDGNSCTGWWMLVSRYRADQSGSASAPPNIMPDESLGDIVAWYSPDPSFRSDQVVGPFRLVANTQCVNDGSGALVYDLRYWLGTAGATVVPEAASGEADALYVYYVVQSSWAKLNSVLDGGQVYSHGRVDEFTAGVWLKKILLSDLASALAAERAAPGTYTDEASWQDFPASGTADSSWPVVTGTIVGRVQVWAASDLKAAVDAGETGSDLLDDDIQSLYDGPDYDDGTPTSVYWADPAPVVGVYDDGSGAVVPSLALLLAAIPTPKTWRNKKAFEVDGYAADVSYVAYTYLGAWATMALTVAQCSAYGLTYGLAFTVRADTSDGTGADKIAGLGTFVDSSGTSFTTTRLDPDPVVWSETENVLVYLGEGYEDGTDYLDLFSAAYTDVFRDATAT